jgi:hypothetical protein
VSIPETAEVAVWDIAVSSVQATPSTWTPATAPTNAGPGWVAARGVPVALAFAVVSGSVQFNLAAADGTWSPLISGWSLPAVRLAQVRLRTASDGNAAVVQITQTRAVF